MQFLLFVWILSQITQQKGNIIGRLFKKQNTMLTFHKITSSILYPFKCFRANLIGKCEILIIFRKHI